MQRSGKYKQGGLLIRRTNQSGKCRVKGCRFYHKFLKNLKRHVEHSHKMTLAEHRKLPPSLLAVSVKKNESKGYMRYRVTEPCQIKRCKRFMQPFNDLTRHLRVSHNMTRKSYDIKRKDDISKEHEVISALSLDKRETVKSEPMTNVEVNLEPSEPDETSEPESDERSVLDSDVPPSSPFNPDDFFSLNK
uniref:C2H2-type domain-containing protein n=2 Tax=Clytia hemisphaerica TaxID=252671 RepID=A0A7M5XQ13_9CNID